MTATHKWLSLAVDIVLYEIQHAGDGQLLSEACDRWIIEPPLAARLFIVSAGLALTAHLANLVHPAYDVVSVHFWRRNGTAWRRINKRQKQFGITVVTNSEVAHG